MKPITKTILSGIACGFLSGLFTATILYVLNGPLHCPKPPVAKPVLTSSEA